jgi:hypothetical protein
MFMDVRFDSLPRTVVAAAWALQQAAAHPSMRETVRQVASILGALLLAGLWVYLAMHRDRRMASLVVLAILGLASGAGYALGKQPRLELLRAAVSQLLIFLEVLISLPSGWREALRTLIIFVAAGSVAAAVGAGLATAFSDAGPVGELLVDFLVALFF